MLDTLLYYDDLVRRWISLHHVLSLDFAMLALTIVGRAGIAWFTLGAALAIWRPSRARGVLQMALAVGLALLLTDAVFKPLVARERPLLVTMDVRFIGERPQTYSFPSGHAATSFAGALALARVWPTTRVTLWSLAVLIAFSRVYLGVHYPSDVLAGALLGLACAAFVIGGTKWRLETPGEEREVRRPDLQVRQSGPPGGGT